MKRFKGIMIVLYFLLLLVICGFIVYAYQVTDTKHNINVQEMNAILTDKGVIYFDENDVSFNTVNR